jgi:2-dehydropantoate 2-reductase
MRIALMAAGAVGGYFGERLARAGHEMALVARGPRLEALRAHGQRVESPLGGVYLPDVEVTDEPSGIGAVDFVLSSVKLCDTLGSRCHQATPRGKERRGVVPERCGQGRCPSSGFGCRARYWGHGLHRGKHRRAWAHPSFRHAPEAGVRRVRRLAIAARGAVPRRRNFVFLVGLSGATSLARSALGSIRSHSRSRAFLHDVMKEVVQEGRAQGVPLPADYADERPSFTGQLPASMRSSMLRDLEQGNRLEVRGAPGKQEIRTATLVQEERPRTCPHVNQRPSHC